MARYQIIKKDPSYGQNTNIISTIKIKIHGLLLFLVFHSIITLGVSDAMVYSNDFPLRWSELSRDVKSLNEYTAKHLSLELKNLSIEEINLQGAIFNGAVFNTITWEQVSAGKSKYRDVIFKNCKFFNSEFWNSEFINVEFINCEFNSVKFIGSTFLNVNISNCIAAKTEFDDLKGGEILIFKTKLFDRSSFVDSKIPLIFRKSELSGVNAMGLSGNNSLTIEDCVLDEVNFGKSHFSTVTLRRVKQGEGGIKFNNILAHKIELDQVDLDGIGFMGAKAKSATVHDSKVMGIGFSDSLIDRIFFRDSTVHYFDSAESRIPHLEFASCDLVEPMLYEGHINEFSVSNSTITMITGFDFKADTVIWDNVTLDGKIDFTNAHIKDFQSTRLRRGPNLQLVTTGSNVRFD